MAKTFDPGMAALYLGTTDLKVMLCIFPQCLDALVVDNNTCQRVCTNSPAGRAKSSHTQGVSSPASSLMLHSIASCFGENFISFTSSKHVSRWFLRRDDCLTVSPTLRFRACPWQWVNTALGSQFSSPLQTRP